MARSVLFPFFVLELALEKYPCYLTTPDGLQCFIRPLQAGDRHAYETFLRLMPDEERLFVEHRFLDTAVFHVWPEKIDFFRHLPLLAFADGKIVADASLHQRAGGWKRHIGLVSVVTHPDYRGRGIVDLLINELVEISRQAGLMRLEAEFNGERDVGILAFQKAGFDELMRLPGYVQDMNALYHDYVLLGMRLKASEELAAAAD